MNQKKPTPILSPIVALLRSRKAMTTLITMVITLLIPFAPGLEEHRADLLQAALVVSGVLASVLALAIGMEDAATKSAPTTVNIPTAGDTNVTSTPADTPAAVSQAFDARLSDILRESERKR